FFNPMTAAGVPLPLGAVRIAVGDIAKAGFVVVLPPERTIEGTIVDADGRGIEGARLAAAVPGNLRMLGRIFREHGYSYADSAGHFAVGGLMEDEYTLIVAVPLTFVPVHPMPDMWERSGVVMLNVSSVHPP